MASSSHFQVGGLMAPCQLLAGRTDALPSAVRVFQYKNTVRQEVEQARVHNAEGGVLSARHQGVLAAHASSMASPTPATQFGELARCNRHIEGDVRLPGSGRQLTGENWPQALSQACPNA